MKRAISLRQLAYFVAVAEERSFRVAAERLHLTQPPLSRAVAELEQQLGLRLLLRSPQGVQPTAAGAQALPRFKALLAQAEQVLDEVAALGDALPRLRLALPAWLNLAQLPAFERALRDSGLISGLETQLLPAHEAAAAVVAGRLDGALLAAPIETQGLPLQTLGQLPLSAFVPQGSALARRRSLSLRDLNQLPPFYRFRRSLSPLLYDHLDRQYRAHGFEPLQELPAAELLDVFSRIGAGQGCTCMPMQIAVGRFAGVVRRPLRDAVSLDLAWLPARQLPEDLATACAEALRLLLPGN